MVFYEVLREGGTQGLRDIGTKRREKFPYRSLSGVEGSGAEGML
ncbi:MAG: hypothetical protein R6V72_10280 [Cyclobacterium sp.]|nr:hypothetical protein [Cyclobacterium sp. SYSU L10401]